MFYRDLKQGTILESIDGRRRVKLKDDMHDQWAYCGVVKKNGDFDQRWRGWSGSLLVSDWVITFRRSKSDPTEPPQNLGQSARG